MRFLMTVRATKDSESGVMPDEKLISAMMRYNEELTKAGVLIDLSGMQPSSKGARVKFSGGKVTVAEGPFPDTGIAGYWLIKVNSKAEAIEWAKCAPAPFGDKGGEIELRQLFEMEDFDVSDETRTQGRKLEKELKRANSE